KVLKERTNIEWKHKRGRTFEATCASIGTRRIVPKLPNLQQSSISGKKMTLEDAKAQMEEMKRLEFLKAGKVNCECVGLKELSTEMSNDDASGAESPPRDVDSYYM
ncbi:hypothetical protein Tco_0264356, partial [Tanacetum coccineum]